MSTLQQLEMQRRALEAQFNTFTKPLEIRMEATLATLTRTHPRMTVDQVHALALEDPHYAADAKVYARYAADYKLKADNVAKRIDELKHGARVGAGLGPELSGDKKSDGAAKKPSSNAKHPVRVPVYNERSLLARVGFNPKNPKQFDAIEAFLNEAKLAHANSVARRKLIAELEQHKDLTAEQRESYEHALAQPDPYKIFLNKVGAMEKKHLRDDAKSKAQARADARSAPRGIRIRGELGSDSSTGSPSTWVGATSVGVVVAMCACVAAFAVVRRRQRQSESAARVVDGYATLV